VIAVIVAIVLFVVAVLPAERGIDPTGIGDLLGLTEMGEMKMEAAKEFDERDAEAKRQADSAAAARAK
jgi:hypothetical protein